VERRCHGGAVGCRRRRVGGGDGGDSRLESGEGMAEREGRREVVVWDRREGGRGAGDGEGAVRRGRSHKSGSFYVPSLLSTSFFLVVDLLAVGTLFSL
jgi:hypothetical protein